MLIVLDISSHWFHVMSVTGHHKSKEALQNRNALLQWYYSIYPLFGYCCVGTELLFILMYVTHESNYKEAVILRSFAVYGCGPACVMKQVVNIAQLLSAAYTICERDSNNRSISCQEKTPTGPDAETPSTSVVTRSRSRSSSKQTKTPDKKGKTK